MVKEANLNLNEKLSLINCLNLLSGFYCCVRTVWAVHLEQQPLNKRYFFGNLILALVHKFFCCYSEDHKSDYRKR